MIGTYNTYEYKTNVTKNPTHIYLNTGVSSTKYNIYIEGDFKGFDNSSSIISTVYNYLYMINENEFVIDTDKTATSTKYYLQTINNWGNVPIESLTNFCINASGLVSIPNTILPNVNQCMSAFMNCINLYKCFNYNISSMSNFQLPLNALNCKHMFAYTNINYDFTNINMPTYLTNISYMFYKTNISGINKNLYTNFVLYYPYENIRPTITSYYYNAFPNTVKATISEFDKDYFKKVLSPHQ